MLKNKRIMIATPQGEVSVIITKVENKKAEFEIIGNIKKEILFDVEAFCENRTVGIIRKTEDKDKLILELWEENSVNQGDVLVIKNTFSCKGDTLYGFNPSTEIPRVIKEILFNDTRSVVKDIRFTQFKSENHIKSDAILYSPDVIIIVYPAKAMENFEISKGCGLVFKDGNAVTDPILRDYAVTVAKNNNISIQAYIGSQLPIIETLGIIGNGAKVIPISIPVNHMDTRNEIIDINDIKSAATLILKIIGG